MQFTKREEEVLECIAHGYTPDETGDFLGITRETVRKIICNIKYKVNLQKSTEITAYYWCKKVGTSLSEQRLKFVSKRKINLCIILMIAISFLNIETKFRSRSRTINEVRSQYTTEYRIRLSRKEV